MANAAKRGLKLHQLHHRGGTQIGLARAKQLSKRQTIADAMIKRMVSYFAWHDS